MAPGINNIPNDMRGAPRSSQGHHHAHPQNKPVHDSRQTNKILELEWEALGKKLNKPLVKENVDVEKLRRQLKDKEEQLKYAESLIANLNAELRGIQQKQAHSQQNQNKPKQNQQIQNQQKQNHLKPARNQGQNKPAGQRETWKKPQQEFQRPSQKSPQARGRK